MVSIILGLIFLGLMVSVLKNLFKDIKRDFFNKH